MVITIAQENILDFQFVSCFQQPEMCLQKPKDRLEFLQKGLME